MRITAPLRNLQQTYYLKLGYFTFLPPEDAEDVGYEQNETDKGREALGVTLTVHRVTLDQVTYVWAQDHSYSCYKITKIISLPASCECISIRLHS